MLKPSYVIPDLPPAVELETVPVFKALARANRALAELKGRAATIPNQGILIETLSMQEAKASSEIENIVTTQDELFRLDLFPNAVGSPEAKEVSLYRAALKLGYDRLSQTGLITNKYIDRHVPLTQRTHGSVSGNTRHCAIERSHRRASFCSTVKRYRDRHIHDGTGAVHQ